MTTPTGTSLDAPHNNPSISMERTFFSITAMSVSSSHGFTSNKTELLAMSAGFLDFLAVYAATHPAGAFPMASKTDKSALDGAYLIPQNIVNITLNDCLAINVPFNINHANFRTRTCEEQLSLLQEYTQKLFIELEKGYGQIKQHLETIEGITYMTRVVLDFFVSADYGSKFDQNMLQCYLKRFIDKFPVKRNEAADRLLDLQEERDKIESIMDDFFLDYNIHCKRGTFTGCDNELNQLRCKLWKFLFSFEDINSLVGPEVISISSTYYNLGKIVKTFSSMYDLKCGLNNNSPSLSYLKADVKILYPVFRQPFDAGVKNVDHLGIICRNATADINAWKKLFVLDI
ncbi:hypothetical protein Bhyg_02782 [Pseudolycoriella hygida]|uniref:Uncharacterized protein n=1 Tax=Pseudolycoriella hygida TaxID=35572 RepID=A0A9Q0S6Y6_9DIPT|nr:hypothetical protein Bhyg_02782 [Pseudolycoriella hygida]